MKTCPNEASHQYLTGAARCQVCNLPAFESLGIPVANSMEEMAQFLRGEPTTSQLKARIAELEAALATETKAREMSWAHHDEHHERDEARLAKAQEALGLEAAWPALFDRMRALREAEAALGRAEVNVAHWRTAASMACESPPDRCDCAGCRFAEQLNAEKLGLIAGGKTGG